MKASKVKICYACALSKCISRAFYYILRPFIDYQRKKGYIIKDSFDPFLQVF